MRNRKATDVIDCHRPGIDRDAAQREVAVLDAAILALELLEAAKAIDFKDKSRMIWTSMNGDWKWEAQLSLTHGLTARHDSPTAAYFALKEKK